MYVIGMGPGHLKYLTLEAIEAVQAADTVLAFGRIAETAEKIRRPVTRIMRMDEVLPFLSNEGRIAVLASGDPCFYGIVDYLKRHDIAIDAILPGLSSMQYMMARLQKSWQQARFFSLHGRDEELEAIKQSPLSVILTDSRNTPQDISQQLKRLGLRGRLYVGYKLSYEDERILERKIGEEIEVCEAISLVVVEHELDS
ncbi:precorrin-6y C5,15-methyltransferase (decarboxylating) subunit CbiE [candidate division KSB3 bacterium]|uniref:Precorrin-6y C5,15-methyltransferase (Decarboxylating) subunit CbiE n=1 Tax=candidate division KSB3 bacterium TaxID=2044937 RepID=A0A2G6EA36_9BACT|nr:MAG: precorrin-6y C5,15-methyltransferase (decarboxylating) subunit CbiE [candidate division KSB3 bacterium]PIE31031.1 MAG: precorrin-6y C5,15-methyltransferase (decarboxylating) subunit CbiE [candidate division KSB3 bacterium]